MDQNETIKLLYRLRDTPVWFKDTITGSKFRARPQLIFDSISDINQAIHEDDVATIGDWFDMLGAEINQEWLAKVGSKGRYYGWHIDCLLENATAWLTFIMRYVDEGPGYFTLSPSVMPDDLEEYAIIEEWR